MLKQWIPGPFPSQKGLGTRLIKPCPHWIHVARECGEMSHLGLVGHVENSDFFQY